MLNILAHRGLWTTLEEQNSINSILLAFRNGFSVEIDLRLDAKNKIYLSHDLDKHPSIYLEDLLESINLMSNFRTMPLIALHIKEDTDLMFTALCKLVNPTSKVILFGLDYESKFKYAEVFGWSKIAYEIETGNMGSVNEAAKSREGIIWIADFLGTMTDEGYSKLRHKSVYLVSPEITKEPTSEEVFKSRFKYLKGICTDKPKLYAKNS